MNYSTGLECLQAAERRLKPLRASQTMMRIMEEQERMKRLLGPTRDLMDSPSFRLTEAMANGPAACMARRLEESAAGKVLHGLAESTIMREVQGLADRPTMKVIRNLDQSSTPNALATGFDRDAEGSNRHR